MASFKILSYNVGQCLGFQGSVPEYVLLSHRHVLCPPSVRKKVLASIHAIIEKEQPDLCCFLEIDPALLYQIRGELGDSYHHHHSENKYGETSILRRIPKFARRSSGFLSKESVPFRMHFLKTGIKKLLYEIQVADDLHVFAGHFALNEEARRKQFEEVIQLLANKRRVILCGDFNIFKGFGELQSLIEHEDLHIINAEGDFTFPAHRPRKCLDLFICSKNVEVMSLHVLREQHGSDHLPVILEIEL